LRRGHTGARLSDGLGIDGTHVRRYFAGWTLAIPRATGNADQSGLARVGVFNDQAGPLSPSAAGRQHHTGARGTGAHWSDAPALAVTAAAAGDLGQAGLAVAQRVAARDQAGVLQKTTGALPVAAARALRGSRGGSRGTKKKPSQNTGDGGRDPDLSCGTHENSLLSLHSCPLTAADDPQPRSPDETRRN
jgi:hypothetical protein